MKFHCCEPRRLEVIKTTGSANAIDFIEVLDGAAPPGAPRQQTLFVRLLRPGFVLTPDNLRITGGVREPTVGCEWCAPANALPVQAEPGLVDSVDDLPLTLVVRTDSSGDYSTYTLALVTSSDDPHAPPGFDPRLSEIEFSFKVECPSDFDCTQPAVCPPAPRLQPAIDYLAKDYQGFRRLMLDRLNLLTPGWAERSAADVGVTLVELLAYAADNLSYRQDAIANEAYLATARQRVSVRRHARLVDYYLHEGCNARAFVHFAVSGHNIGLPAGAQLLTGRRQLKPNGQRDPGSVVLPPNSPKLRDALAGGALVFETAHPAVLDADLNQLSFYTWGDGGCCLPRGATRATLRGHMPALSAGDFLLFEEMVSPTTFDPADASPAHRWIVRLTDVTPSSDPSGQLFNAPPVDGPIDITEIAWDASDALPFPVCLSVTDRPGLEISVARGNVVLADHGAHADPESLGTVPDPTLQLAATGDVGCDHPAPAMIPPRFRPALSGNPLTFGFDLAQLLAVPISVDEAWWPASSLLVIDPRTAMPRITALTGTLGAVVESWTPRRDLLGSDDAATDFTVEVEDDGRARLRFGDDTRGKRPDPGTQFDVVYRVGNGAAGNVGAGAIACVVSNTNGLFQDVRNPLSAAGGSDPEDIEVARRDAPQAFRTQERAVTRADYAEKAAQRPDVQRAAATFRWTGSWYTVFVTPDRFGGGTVDAPFAARLRRYLERYRMAGYDLDVRTPAYVPLDIALHVCVLPDYFRADVLQAALQVLSSGMLPDGRLGLFHPDNFSFGEPVYLSRVIAAVQALDGVDAVRADCFQRLVNPIATSLDDEVITIGDLEIAQLANDPSFPERGRLVLTAGGGK